jgi:hypothetical protein
MSENHTIPVARGKVSIWLEIQAVLIVMAWHSLLLEGRRPR